MDDTMYDNGIGGRISLVMTACLTARLRFDLLSSDTSGWIGGFNRHNVDFIHKVLLIYSILQL